MFDRREASQQIRNLLLVLFLGIICAITISLFFLHYYGPPGTYQLKNVMIEPGHFKHLSYSDKNSGKEKAGRYSFEEILFDLWDPEYKKWIKKSVPLEQYRMFYQRNADEKSLEASEQVERLFRLHHPARLTVNVSEQNEKGNFKIFQEVQFVQGDYFRIELREQRTNGVNWVYFYKPGIYLEVKDIFLNEQ